jgi:hypothetical protein
MRQLSVPVELQASDDDVSPRAVAATQKAILATLNRIELSLAKALEPKPLEPPKAATARKKMETREQ